MIKAGLQQLRIKDDRFLMVFLLQSDNYYRKISVFGPGDELPKLINKNKNIITTSSKLIEAILDRSGYSLNMDENTFRKMELKKFPKLYIKNELFSKK
jgi:hypothetical protein